LIPIFERTDIADAIPPGPAIFTGTGDDVAADDSLGDAAVDGNEIGDKEDDANPGVRNTAGAG
jgi:hypothetical protein